MKFSFYFGFFCGIRPSNSLFVSFFHGDFHFTFFLRSVLSAKKEFLCFFLWISVVVLCMHVCVSFVNWANNCRFFFHRLLYILILFAHHFFPCLICIWIQIWIFFHLWCYRYGHKYVKQFNTYILWIWQSLFFPSHPFRLFRLYILSSSNMCLFYLWMKINTWANNKRCGIIFGKSKVSSNNITDPI